MTPTVAEHDALVSGVRLSEAMPELQQVADQMITRVIARAMTALRSDKLTPELSMQLWHEISSIKALLSNMRTKITLGEKYADKMPAIGDE